MCLRVLTCAYMRRSDHPPIERGDSPRLWGARGDKISPVISSVSILIPLIPPMIIVDNTYGKRVVLTAG